MKPKKKERVLYDLKPHAIKKLEEDGWIVETKGTCPETGDTFFILVKYEGEYE